ncbi:MAG: helix-turn-helix domain-containing protein, partial [Nitrospinae bacterium]|nr:helix-turn-helix domain-containing protein [Nitrospinota bacterium]
MKLEAWRNNNGVSRLAFAEKIKTSDETVRRYENGDRIPAREIMSKITEVTGSKVMAGDFYDLEVAGETNRNNSFRTDPLKHSDKRTTGRFPRTRLRRNRAEPWSRALVAETSLSVNDLIWPVFITERADAREPIASMPGVDRLGIDAL